MEDPRKDLESERGSREAAMMKTILGFNLLGEESSAEEDDDDEGVDGAKAMEDLNLE